MRKLLFVVTEDWFFASHFLPMARVGLKLGLDVVVVTRVRDHAEIIEATGARVVALEAERRSTNPLHALDTARRLAAILRRERPDLVHCISLKPILVGGLAARLAGVKRTVFALTGLGFLGARQDGTARLAAGWFAPSCVGGWRPLARITCSRTMTTRACSVWTPLHPR